MSCTDTTTSDEKTCTNCQRRVDVHDVVKAGGNLFDVAMGVGMPCASCSRNPDIVQVASIMTLFGRTPTDNWLALKDVTP
jgi:hypothetical protein